MMLFQVIGGKSTEKRVHRNKNEQNRSPDEAWGSKTSKETPVLPRPRPISARPWQRAYFWVLSQNFEQENAPRSKGSAEASPSLAKALAEMWHFG